MFKLWIRIKTQKIQKFNIIHFLHEDQLFKSILLLFAFPLDRLGRDTFGSSPPPLIAAQTDLADLLCSMTLAEDVVVVCFTITVGPAEQRYHNDQGTTNHFF